MKIAEHSVRLPVTVTMAVLSVLVLGGISLQRLPLALLPDISSSSLSVFASYPSSSPGEVERDIARPLEEVLSTLNHLDKIQSNSSSSGANVRLEFKPGTNMDLVSLEVRDKIDQVRGRLPAEVERVTIRRWQSSDSPVYRFALGWKGEPKDLYGFIEDVLRPHLERIDGVANVDVGGVDAKQIIIDLDPVRLQAHGIDIFQLSQELRANNLNLSGGYVIEGGKKYTLRTVGEFSSVEEIRSFPLSGGRLTLGDLADVRFDFPEKNSFSRLNSQDSVTLVIYKASTANVVKVCEAVTEELEQLSRNPRYADLFETQVFRDQSRDILSSIRDLAKAGIFGGLLASVVLFLFLLKFRSTLIISLAIPVSVVFTFAFMYLLRVVAGIDITINIVSLMGLMVAVGMLVDSSVVVLENIFRYKQDHGLGAFQASIRGAGEVGVAVLASTATTVCVFLSFLFVEDSFSSRWLRDFGITVSAALVAAMVVSLTLVPMLAARVFTGKEKPRQRALVALTNGYKALMGMLLRRRFVTLIVMGLVGWASWTLFQSIDRDLLPRVSEREVRLDVLVERSFSLAEMEALFARLEKGLLERKAEFEIASISSSFNNRSSRRGQYRGDLTIYLRDDGPGTPAEVLTERIKASLPEAPGVEYRVGRRRGYGGGGDLGVEIQLKGDDPALLEVYGDLVKQRLFEVPGIKDVQTTLESGDDEIHLEVDRKKTERFGVSTSLVARTVSSALSSRATTRVKSDEGEIDVVLQMKGGNRISLQEVQNIQLENRRGEMIPLHSIVDYQFRRGPVSIQREDRKATLSVVGNTSQGGLFRVSQSVREALADLNLPPGYSWEIGGGWRRFQESEQSNYFSVVLAVILMYIIMAALFESFVHPLTILFTVPFSVIGVAGLFYLTNTTLNQMSYLGILVLFGLVVNNGIILIDHVNYLRNQGMPRREALLQAGSDRLRPILMTACTSLFGLMPLSLPFIFPGVFGGVEGRSLQWAPVSLAVFGGLTTSTFLTLIILPAIYTYMDDLSGLGLRAARWLGSLGRSAKAEAR